MFGIKKRNVYKKTVAKTKRIAHTIFELSPFSKDKGIVNKRIAKSVAKKYRFNGFYARIVEKRGLGWLVYIKKVDLPRRLKNQTYKDTWTGDWDFDGVSNIDDRYPFDSTRRSRVNNEVSLSKKWKHMQGVRTEYKKDIRSLAYKVDADKYRTKNPYSIIAKQLGRYLVNIQDMGGLMILCDTREEVKRTGQKLRTQLGKDVIEYDDKYLATLNDPSGTNPHMGIHMTIRYRNRPYEVQIKTKKMYKIDMKAHKHYKKGNVIELRKLRADAIRNYNRGLI